MNSLREPAGIFDLNNSNRCVGSYLKKSDICEILGVKETNIACLKFKMIGDCEVIDERKVQKAWYDGEINNAPSCKAGSSKKSLDECILKKIIEITYPEAEIDPQYKWGRKRIDFKIIVAGESKFIEFLGPSHFIPYYGPPTDPFIRKNEIEKEFGCECVLWPYWIQRCVKNVRAVFENNVKGLGVLWSANIQFSDFYFDDSAEIIDTMNKRFNAEDNGGYGYFYGPNTCGRNNPQHPIIEKIVNKEESALRLLPNGFADKNRWLPNKLK